MTTLYRFTNVWSEFIGGPGINQFTFSRGTSSASEATIVQDMYDEIHGLYADLVGLWVYGVKIRPGQEAVVFDSETGEITSVVPVGETGSDITGSSSGDQAPRSLAICASLGTDNWLHGRRLRGRHFLGPVGSTVLDTDGQVTTAAQSAVEDAYTAMTSGVGVRLAVYHRNKPGETGAGAYGDVVQVTAGATPSNIRSRLR